MRMTMATRTGTTTLIMGTDSALLQLIWLASPALPIGGFSYSEGLEAAIDHELVTTEAQASEWLSHQLHLSLARGDLAVLAQAIPAWQAQDRARIATLNDWVLQTRETSELRQQTEQMGRSLIEWLRSLRPELVEDLELGAASGEGRTDLTYPVAYALAAAQAHAPLRDTLLAYAFGWAENMMQAAIKAVPLGQSAGQRILQRMASEIPAAVDLALRLDDDSRQAFSPMLSVLSARHETQYSRLFRS